MKKRIYVLFTCIAWASFGFVFAQQELEWCGADARWCYNDTNTPMRIVEAIVDNDDSDIIETELDEVNNTQIYGAEYTISWTLESVRQQMAPYVQRIAFIGLASAVILIIYNGLLLVTTPLSPDQATTVQKRMWYISAGIVLITGFYFILKVLLAIFVDIFVK